jgi:hypothetical protein
MHDVHVNQEEFHECVQENTLEDFAEIENGTRLINATRSSSPVNGIPGDIRQSLLSGQSILL